MAKAKTLLLKKKNTHTFLKMDEDKSSFLYLPSNVASQRYVSNTLSHFKIPLAEPLTFVILIIGKLASLNFTFLVHIII